MWNVQSLCDIIHYDKNAKSKLTFFFFADFAQGLRKLLEKYKKKKKICLLKCADYTSSLP